MSLDRSDHLVCRDARAGDLDALSAIKPPRALHQDRLRDAANEPLRYLVAGRRGQLGGFGLLVIGRPRLWAPIEFLPQMIDLFVQPDQRGRGLGSALIGHMEQLTRRAGLDRLHVAVDPQGNPRALALYRRLGYRPLYTTPREDHWYFEDSAGRLHEGVDRVIHLQRRLD